MSNEQLFRFALRQNELCLDNASIILIRLPETLIVIASLKNRILYYNTPLFLPFIKPICLNNLYPIQKNFH